MGSSAGAGSGEFHVYRHLRRKEYARQKHIQLKADKVRYLIHLYNLIQYSCDKLFRIENYLLILSHNIYLYIDIKNIKYPLFNMHLHF